MRAALIALMISPGVLLAGTPGEEAKITINRLSGQDFEVVSGSFTATAEYFWCGAASFVEQRSGLSSLTPIYIKRPVGLGLSDGARKSVIFTTSGAGLPQAKNEWSLSVSQSGLMMKSHQARRLCRDAFTRSTK